MHPSLLRKLAFPALLAVAAASPAAVLAQSNVTIAPRNSSDLLLNRTLEELELARKAASSDATLQAASDDAALKAAAADAALKAAASDAALKAAAAEAATKAAKADATRKAEAENAAVQAEAAEAAKKVAEADAARKAEAAAVALKAATVKVRRGTELDSAAARLARATCWGCGKNPAKLEAFLERPKTIPRLPGYVYSSPAAAEKAKPAAGELSAKPAPLPKDPVDATRPAAETGADKSKAGTKAPTETGQTAGNGKAPKDTDKPTAKSGLISERRMWYRLGGLMQLEAEEARAAAKNLYQQELFQNAYRPTDISTAEDMKTYRKKVVDRKASLDTQMDLFNTLDALANFYSYHGLNLNRLNFFPVRHRQHAPLYFNSASSTKAGEFLGRSTTAINPSNGKISQYSEVYSDYLGFTKATVGLMVVSSKNKPDATPEENRETEAVQRLSSGGGNLVFAVALPLVSFHTRDNHFAIKGHFMPRFATDLPQQGQPSDNFAYHSEATVEFFGYYNGYNSQISPYASMRVGRNWGNGNFYDNLQRESHAGFTLFQVDAGLALGDAVQVGIRYNSGQSFIQEAFPLSIALSVFPQALTK